MTVTDLARELQDHAESDHKRGCPGRQYTCDCRYDMETERLLLAGAKEIRRLQERLDRLEYEPYDDK